MKRNANLILHHILWRGLYFISVLILNIFIARFFAAEKSGQVFYIVNNLSFILLLFSMSLESGAGYYLASGSLRSAALARFCLLWATFASLLAAFSWWAILYYSNSVYLRQTGFLSASFLFILGVLYTTYFTALFYAKKEFGLPNKILSVVNVLLIILLIAGRFSPIVHHHFILIYFSGFFLQGLLLTVFFFTRDYTILGRNTSISAAMLKKITQYSLTALLANVIYFLVNRIDYWFVEYFCSAKDLGNYIQASKLGQMLLVLPGILGATLFPIFTSRKNYGSTKELSAVTRTLFWINTIACVLILSVGWFIFPFVFGKSFNEMYLLFVFLIPGVLAFTMNYPLAAWFSASKRIGVNVRGGLIALSIICLGDIFILPRLGIFSASLISSAGYLCFFIYTLFIYTREFKLSPSRLLLIRKSDINLLRESLGIKIPESNAQDIVVQNPGL